MKPEQDGKDGVDDDSLINAIYDERSRKDKDGKMVYFGDLDLSKRFTQERQDAQAALTRERKAKVRTDNASLICFRQRIAQLPSS